MSGLFSIFNVANRGMAAQQKAINVTSHNIANANTAGYSRQRVVMETTRPFGMPTMNTAFEPGQIGTGVEVSAVERVRDSFLDFQVRNETSKYGQFQARDKFLSEIEGIFNEPSDTGISSLLGKFFDSWHVLGGSAESSNSRTIVVQQAAALTDALNHTATQLENLKTNTQEVIKNTVFEVNDILGQIDQLNQQIIGVKVAAQNPNDLQDRRDLLIDRLSSKFNIEIKKDSFDGVNVLPQDKIGLSNPMIVKAQENDNVNRLSYVNSIEEQKNIDGTPVMKDGKKVYNITYFKLGDMDKKVTVTDVPLSSEEFQNLDQGRVFWADKDGYAISTMGNKLSGISNSGVQSSDGQISMDSFSKNSVLFKPTGGELKGYMSVQEDIDNYMNQLNKIAKVVAFSVNALHSGVPSEQTGTQSKDYMPFFVNSDVANKNYIKSADGTKNVLFNSTTGTAALDAVLNSESQITAKNISVNKQLMDDVMQIKTRLHDNEFATASENTKDGINDGSRAMAIAQLRNKLISIQDIGYDNGSLTINTRQDLFTKGKNKITQNGNLIEFESNLGGMKIDNYFKDVIATLGVQGGEAKRIVKNQESLLQSFEQTRESISGVSLDEEMANLIQYQHAYQANAKIIATVDELLDVVVNGLKR